MFFQLFLFILFFCLSIENQAGQPENVQHSSISSKFLESHSNDMDHKAILGIN